MKTIIQTTASLFLLVSSAMAQIPPGDDPFGHSEPGGEDFNQFNYERLKKAGITIESVSPTELGFVVEQEGLIVKDGFFGREELFVRVTFDCAKLGKDQTARMNLQLIGKDLKTIAIQDVGRKKGDGDKLEMTFFVSKIALYHSYLNIVVSKPQTGAEKHDGTLVFDTKTLWVRRIMELAKQKKAGESINKPNKSIQTKPML